MINNIEHNLISADRFCDKIPVISSINNLVDLAQKALRLSFKTRNSVEPSHYFFYLAQKSAARCIILLIPFIGNIAVAMFDFAKAQMNEAKNKVANPSPFKIDEEYIKIRENPKNLKYAREELRSDELTVSDAVTEDGLVLEHASKELKNNLKVVERAVEQNGMALQFAIYGLQSDEEIVKAAVAQNGMALQFASAELRNNFDVVIEAVAQDGRALQFASDDLKNNLKIALVATKQNGMALQYTLPHSWLRNNARVVQAATEQNKKALQFASEKMQKDPQFVQKSRL
jgi:hypothetical protein